MFFEVLVIEGVATFFKVLFSIISNEGIFAMIQLLHDFQVTSISIGGFALSTSLNFPFKVGMSFSFNFHKSYAILTLTNNFNKSALTQKKLFTVIIS